MTPKYIAQNGVFVKKKKILESKKNVKRNERENIIRVFA